MAKSRKANYSWRSRMRKHLDENPQVLEQVNAIKLGRLQSQKQAMLEAQEAIVKEAESLQLEIDRLSTSDTSNAQQ